STGGAGGARRAGNACGSVCRYGDGEFTQDTAAADAAVGHGTAVAHQPFALGAPVAGQTLATLRRIGAGIRLRRRQPIMAGFLEGGAGLTAAGLFTFGV